MIKGLVLLLVAAALIVACGLIFGHTMPVRAALAVTILASFPLAEKILF